MGLVGSALAGAIPAAQDWLQEELGSGLTMVSPSCLPSPCSKHSDPTHSVGRTAPTALNWHEPTPTKLGSDAWGLAHILALTSPILD